MTLGRIWYYIMSLPFLVSMTSYSRYIILQVAYLRCLYRCRIERPSDTSASSPTTHSYGRAPRTGIGTTAYCRWWHRRAICGSQIGLAPFLSPSNVSVAKTGLFVGEAHGYERPDPPICKGRAAVPFGHDGAGTHHANVDEG